MAKKTNTTINGNDYYRIERKIGVKQNKRGEWVSEYKQFYGKSKKEAEQKYRDFMDSRKRTPAGSRPLRSVIDEWIESTFALDPDTTEGTKRLYRDAYEKNFRQADVCKIALADVTALDLQSAISGMSCGASTVHQLVKLLRRFFKYATSQGYIATDPAAALVLPKIERKRKTQDIEVWTDEEIARILSALDEYAAEEGRQHRLRLFIVLALDTGMRCGELLGLKYSDFDMQRKTVFVQRQLTDSGSSGTHVLADTKTRSSIRTIPLSDRVMNELNIHRSWSDPEALQRGSAPELVFVTASGLPLDDQNVRVSLRRFYRRYGIPERSPHVYRHTFGSRLAAAGVPIQTVAALLGHDSINTTAKYYLHIADTAKISAISALVESVKLPLNNE